MKHLTPAYIAEYMKKLKWLEENPVTISVSEELHMTKLERKEMKKRK
jgi:hypothetical protein